MYFVPLVESGICLLVLVDVATLSTIHDVRHPLLLPPGYPTQELISRPQAVRPPSSTPFCNLFPRTYIRRRLIPYYDSGPLHKHQIYMRPIFHMSQGVESLGGRLVNLLLPVGQRTDL